jgi:hypothetical protein
MRADRRATDRAPHFSAPWWLVLVLLSPVVIAAWLGAH